MLNKLQENKRELLLLTILLLISGVVHGYNMFHFPYFENDEGTYFAQAWSFLAHGKLSPYTYWYDHAPLGWIFTSIWIFLTGGLFSFGFSLYSARVFMLIIHLLSTFLLFKITRKITESSLSAFIAGVFFAVSPLAIYFQRRFLLDNLMTFWILLSLYLILFSKERLRYFMASALTFGIAVLTKENAIFFLPVYAWLVAREAHHHNRMFAVTQWIIISLLIISFYPLFALLKQELFPVGSIFSPAWKHVSLLGTLKDQVDRGSGLPFWMSGSDFLINLNYWYGKDQLFIILGFLSFFIQALLGVFTRTSRIIFFLTFSILLFLISGKLVISFYVLPLIPFLAMCIGLTIHQLAKLFESITKYAYPIVAVIIIVAIGYYYYNHTQEPLLKDETSKQVEAIDWIKKNIPPDKSIAIDFYGYSDLSESRFSGDPKFNKADWFWKVELDSDIRVKKLGNNPRNIDYVMVTAELQRQLKGFKEGSSILRQALNNSSKTADFAFEKNFDFTLDLVSQKYPNGDWVVIYKQNGDQDILKTAWERYKETFITSEGKVIDASTSRTTSEGQSYALLRSVWANDKKTFDLALTWTLKNMLLDDKSLFAWWYGEKADKTSGIIDKGTATDADEDIAFALILANKRWGEKQYVDLSKQIIDDVWKYETATVKEKKYITAGNWAGKEDEIVVNPSYLAPYIYREFAEVDKNHNWLELVDTSYEILNRCSRELPNIDNHVGLPPDWCVLTKAGKIQTADEQSKLSSIYSFDAIRVTWRVAADYLWNKEERAINYLNSITFWKNEWQAKGKIYATYTHNGEPIFTDESLSSYGTQLAYFSITNPDIANQIYKQKILSQWNKDGYWGKKDNYYDQNWAWFGTAFYTNNLPNLWGTN